MSNEILIENAKLREALAQIGGFANSWGKQVGGTKLMSRGFLADKFEIIEQTCKAALEQK